MLQKIFFSLMGCAECGGAQQTVEKQEKHSRAGLSRMDLFWVSYYC